MAETRTEQYLSNMEDQVLRGWSIRFNGLVVELNRQQPLGEMGPYRATGREQYFNHKIIERVKGAMANLRRIDFMLSVEMQPARSALDSLKRG